MPIPRIPESYVARQQRRHSMDRAFLRLTGVLTSPSAGPQGQSGARTSTSASPGTSSPLWFIYYSDLPVRLTGFGATADWAAVLHPHEATGFETEDAALTAALAHHLGGLAYRIAPVDPSALRASLAAANESLPHHP